MSEKASTLTETDEPAQSGPVRRGRGRPRDPKTDLRITQAAAELLLTRGFDKMTVDQVAADAGVGKATVYRRWPSKEDLAVTAISQILATEFPEPDTGSIVTDLRQSFQALVAFSNSDTGAAFLRMSIAESIRDPRIAALYRQSTERREAIARRTFERAIERGEVRPDADLDAAIQWLGGVLVVRCIGGRPMPSENEVDSYLEFTLRGILADPSGFDRRPVKV